MLTIERVKNGHENQPNNLNIKIDVIIKCKCFNDNML
jgi:hypothetical protein